MKTLSLAVTLLIIALSAGDDKLTGRWQSQPSPDGRVTSVLFRTDGSFEGFVDRKPFVTATYTLQDSIFSFKDNGCNGATGIYKIIFFSNADSIRFSPINDSCTERKNSMIRLVLGKIK